MPQMRCVEHISHATEIMKSFYIKFLLFIFLPLTVATSQTTSQIVRLIREGHIEEARNILSRMKGAVKQPDKLLFLKGLLSTNTDTASAYYGKLLKLYPESQYCDDAYFRLSQLKYAQGLYKTAQKMFARLLIKYPHSSLRQECHYWIGLCYQATGQTDSAAFQFQKVVKDFPATELSQIARKDLNSLSRKQNTERKPPISKPKTLYAVQVGAFTYQANALFRKSFFEREGYQVELRTKIRNGKALYLVWVGSFSTMEEAKKLGEKLKKHYGIQYTLVSE